MAKFCSLFSGSEGNSVYIGSGESGILIDCGRSAKQISEALAEKGIAPESLKAVFVTHEHSDHIRGIRVFSKKYSLPVYATSGTVKAMKKTSFVDEKVELYELEDEMEIGEFKVSYFHTLHDTPDSCGYVVETPDGRKVAVCTDLGCVTDEVKSAIEGVDLVLLESNHEENMLMTGPYPYPLKMRIKSEHGHLCNEDCDKELVELVNKGTTRIFLGHLSRENNTPEIALVSAVSALSGAGLTEGFDYEIAVCPPVNHEKVVIF